MQITRLELPGLALAIAALALTGAPTHAEPPPADVQEVLDCVQANLPKSTSVQRMHFESRDRAGGGRRIESKVQWRRFEDGLSKVLVRVHAPNDLRGSGLLLIEKESRADMFVYLPDLEKVRRVTSRMLGGSMFGSDFTYEDFSQLQGMAAEGRSERLADADFDGSPVRVISHHPAEGSGSSYERVTTYVDAATCIPLRSEMYETGDRLRKVLTADPSDVYERDGVRIPRRLRMEDRRDQSATDLVVTEIEVEVELKDRIFTVSTLERPRIN
jgi:hypothetical protein